MAEICDAAVERACAAGVRGVLLAGVDAPGWRDAAAVFARIRHRLDVGLAYGVHPQAVGALRAGGSGGALSAEPAGTGVGMCARSENGSEKGSESRAEDGSALDEQLAALFRAARGEPLADGEPPLPRPHAIGELGLHAANSDAPADILLQQERAFRAQLALARQLDLPLVLHVVRAHGQALRILQRDGVPRSGGVVHSYSGSAELVADYVRLGLHLSFAGPITYPEARRVQAAACRVPRDRLLVETDAPDQTPWARKPAACEPAFLPDIVEALARHRGEACAELARSTEANARRLFGLPQTVIDDPEPSCGRASGIALRSS